MQGVLNQPVISGSTMLHDSKALGLKTAQGSEQYYREDKIQGKIITFNTILQLNQISSSLCLRLDKHL